MILNSIMIKTLSYFFSKDQLINYYWRVHPRFEYFKNCQSGNFLDVGASDGVLSFWKDWQEPNRNDIKMFGVDLSVGKYKDNYEDFVIVNLEKSDIPYENNSFSSVMISHVVEHINDTSNIVSNLKRLVTK